MGKSSPSTHCPDRLIENMIKIHDSDNNDHHDHSDEVYDPLADGIPEDIAEEIEALTEDVPGIKRMARFAEGLGSFPWFARMGSGLDNEVRQVADNFLTTLGFPDAYVSELESFEMASEAAESLDYNSDGWEAEEQLRIGLVSAALEVMSEESLTVLLNHVHAQAGEAIFECVQETGLLLGIQDEQALHAAGGHAVLAAHHASLLLLAGDLHPDIEDPETHPFAYKFRLFDLGHWPIGLHGQTYNIF